MAPLFAQSAVPDDGGEGWKALRNELDQVESPAQLSSLAKEYHAKAPAMRDRVWDFAGIGAMSDALMEDPANLCRALKYAMLGTAMELASQASREPLAEGPKLLVLDNLAIKALQDDGFSSPGLAAFLRHHPPMLPAGVDGVYDWVRLRLPDQSVHVFERSDVPLDGIGPEWVASAGTDPPLKAGEGDGLSFAFPLPATDFLIGYAKMLVCAQRLPPGSTSLRYVHLIAASCLQHMSKFNANGFKGADYAWRAQSELVKAIHGFERTPPPAASRLLQVQTLRAKLAATRFFGGNLTGALQDYVAAESAMPEAKLWARWGQAVCRFGLHDPKAGAAFREILASLDPKRASDQGFLSRLRILRDALGEEALFGSKLPHESEALLDAPGAIDTDPEYRMTARLDAARILDTLGLFDADARVFIKAVAETSDPALRLRYTRELGAALEATFTLLSWQTTFTGTSSRMVLRTEKDKAKGDFAWAPIDQIQPRDPSGYPYGMSDPEDDKATCVELYSPAGVARSQSLLQNLLPKQAASATASSNVVEFRQWAGKAWSNGSPTPYLKLVWIEWFFLPFSTMPSGDASPPWKYAPHLESGITDREEVRKRFGASAGPVDPQVKKVCDVFCEAYDVLTR